MNPKQHSYNLDLVWEGNLGQGTKGYKSYARDYQIKMDGKPSIAGSSDPAFLGDPTRHNPEDLFLASVSGCHMLWYLHLCSVAGVIVTAYSDAACGVMEENKDGSGQFSLITLRPTVTIADKAYIEKAKSLHERVGDLCFIARSIKTPIHHEVSIVVADAG